MKKIIFLLTFICYTISAQAQISGFDYGTIDDRTYSNQFFHCKLTVPDHWHVQTKAQNEELMQKGAELVAGQNENLKEVLDENLIRVANLLSVFKYKVGSNLGFNANIVMIAENVKQVPTIKNGKDYLKASKLLLEKSAFKYDYISEEYELLMLGGKPFYTMQANMLIENAKINQVYFACILRGFALTFVITYQNEKDQETLSNILNSLEFDDTKQPK